MYSLTNIVQVIIIFQGSLLALFILAYNKPKSRNDFFLALLIGALVLQITGIFLVNRNIQTNFFNKINSVYLFLYGPLLYLYSKDITFSDFKFKLKDTIHFLPFILILTTSAFLEERIPQVILYMAYAIHILSYILACFWQLKMYRKVLMDNYSKLESLNVKWLKWTLILFSLIVIVDGIQIGSILVFQKLLRLEIIVFILILAVINLLYFSGFNQPKVKRFNTEELELSISIKSRKRRNTSLIENKTLINRLEKYLAETESYKNPNITIGLLSEEIDIPKRTLSELINDHYDKNFVDFINTYRIKEAKVMLMNMVDPNLTILEVMYEVGFNSKSSFNSTFKKKTNLTPSEFKSKYK